MAKSVKEKKVIPKNPTEESSAKPKKAAAKSKDIDEDDDLDLDEEKPTKKGGASANEDDEDDDVDVDDEWDKAEEDESWDPDFQEFDVPKSGSKKAGGKFDKNNEIFNIEWDFIIVDVAHEGTETELGKTVISELAKTSPKILYLSGTPFNILGNYQQEEIYTWDYVMEQKAKKQWDEIYFGDHIRIILDMINITFTTAAEFWSKL
jgi:hypothetical protein